MNLSRKLHILLFLFSISRSAPCDTYRTQHPAYNLECGQSLLKTSTHEYHQLLIEEKPHIMRISKDKVNDELDKALKSTLTLSSSEQIEGMFYDTFKLDDYVPLTELLTQSDNIPVIDLYVSIGKKVKDLSTTDRFISNLSIDNILIAPNAAGILFIDLTPAENITHIESQLSELKLLLRIISKNTKPSFGHHTEKELKTDFTKQYNALIDYISDLKVDNFHIDALILKFVTFKDDIKANEGFKTLCFKPYVNKRTGKLFSVADWSYNQREIMCIITITLMLLLMLIITIVLMGQKVPNFTEEDFEMKVVSRPSIVAEYN